jgi:hypothetical protein
VPLPPILGSIVGWLREGYPEGVPDRDYIPLFALLTTELSGDEAKAIADELAQDADPTSARAIREAITSVTSQRPSDADVARVRSHLAAGGWPLAAPSRQTT